MRQPIITRHYCPVCQTVGGEICCEVHHASAPDGVARWRECPGCRLWYQVEYRRLAEMTDLFDGVNRPLEADTKIDDYRKRFDAKLPGFQRRHVRYMNIGPTSGRLAVEVGCGGGLMLHLLRESGAWENVVGIEIVERYALHARNLGFDARWCDVSVGVPEDLHGRADRVICNEVMEHMEHPVDCVAGCFALLRPGGVLSASFAVPDGRTRHGASEWQYWRRASVEELLSRACPDAADVVIQDSSTTGFYWVTR